MSLDRRVTLIVLGAVCAIIAYFVGFPMTATGVLAGLPVGLINFQMLHSLRQRLAEADGTTTEQASALAQRTMLRLLLSVGALLLASSLGPEFLIGVLIGVVLEVLSYFGDAMKLFFRHKE